METSVEFDSNSEIVMNIDILKESQSLSVSQSVTLWDSDMLKI